MLVETDLASHYSIISDVDERVGRDFFNDHEIFRHVKHDRQSGLLVCCKFP